MKNTSGIDPRFGPPLQGSGIFFNPSPGALPRATVDCPFGALEHDISSAKGATCIPISTNGAFHDSLGQRPRTNAPHIPQALKGRLTR
jgi:hypothetical protein